MESHKANRIIQNGVSVDMELSVYTLVDFLTTSSPQAEGRVVSA